MLQTLNWLPSIPWDLSYHAGIPMMFAYGPELYEFHSWGAAGDGDLLLDNHTWADNLLSHKLAHMHGGLGSNEPSPSRVASPAGSAAHHLPASSHPRTPFLRTNIVRSCSNLASSHGSQTTELKLPARSGDQCGKDSKSICQDDGKTNEEGGDNYEDEAPGAEGEDTDTESSEESSSDTGESSSQSSHSSLETMVRFRFMRSHQQKGPKKAHQLRGTRQMTQNLHAKVWKDANDIIFSHLLMV